MMESFTEMEFREKVGPRFKAVFANSKPFDAPFQPEIHPRLLLFEFQWRLAKPWLEPVVMTLKELGEEGFYVSALNRPEPADQTQPYHWYVPLNEAGRYGSLVISQENAIYSVNSQWGIICSGEDHALLGGPELLIKNIRNSVPDLDNRVYKFLEMWKYYHKRSKANISWMPGMLSHVYSPEKTAQLLRQAQLDWLLHDKE